MLAESEEWIDREVGTGVTVVPCVCSISGMKTEILTPMVLIVVGGGDPFLHRQLSMRR